MGQVDCRTREHSELIRENRVSVICTSRRHLQRRLVGDKQTSFAQFTLRDMPMVRDRIGRILAVDVKIEQVIPAWPMNADIFSLTA